MLKRCLSCLLVILLINQCEALDVHNFDPNKMAAMETEAWKAYYSHEKITLMHSVASMINLQFGVKEYRIWLTIAPQLAWSVIRFKNLPDDTPKKEYETKVLPSLIKAYAQLKEIIGANWDPAQVARLDLEWWVLRRDPKTFCPEIVGRTIAKLYDAFYGTNDKDHFDRAGYLRALAARYRDLCVSSWKGLSASDWTTIEKLLEESYQELKLGILSNHEIVQ